MPTHVIGLTASHVLHPGQTNPVDSVDWEPTTDFAKKASEKTKKKIRLPEESEWEWACRAGTTTRV